jgi:hypothetical protein
MSEEKEYRVFKLSSKNSEKYYIDYTKHKGYISMVLHNLITRYNKYGDNLERYKEFFYVIACNDIYIEELNAFESYVEAKDYIVEYKEKNDKYVNEMDIKDYVYKEGEIRCVKEKVDKKKYIKEYYEKNKERYKERYQKNKETILKIRKENYIKKKKDIV